MATTSIPTINLRRAREGEAARREVAAQLVMALEEVGFLYLDDVEGFDPQELRLATEWFFSLPEEEKLRIARKQWNPNNTNVYRGFFPARGAVSHKEALEIGMELPPDDEDVRRFVLYEPNLWPNESGGANFPAFPGFREMMMQYYEHMSQTAIELVRLVAIGMGLDEHYYDELFLAKPLSTLRLLHYPPRNDPPPIEAQVDGEVLQCEAHCDTPALTLLATFEFGGLQVLTKDEKWLDVAPCPNSLIMNIGDVLSRMTKGRLKATLHRVRTIDQSKSRFSVPFFLEPCYRANIAKFLPADEKTKDELEHYGPWLIHRMVKVKKYVEVKDIDFGDYTNVS